MQFLLYLCTRFFTETTMKRIFRYFGALLVASIPFSAVLGDVITHDFNEMNTSPRTINFGTGNTSATTTTDDIKYTCGGAAVFAAVNAKIGIKMYEEGDYTIIGPAIAGLYELQIGYNIIPKTEREEIEVYISSDGDDWGEPLSEGVAYSSGLVRVVIPRGDYQVKLRNKGSKDVFINTILYYYETCNCFRYVPE